MAHIPGIDPTPYGFSEPDSCNPAGMALRQTLFVSSSLDYSRIVEGKKGSYVLEGGAHRFFVGEVELYDGLRAGKAQVGAVLQIALKDLLDLHQGLGYRSSRDMVYDLDLWAAKDADIYTVLYFVRKEAEEVVYLAEAA